jgi:CRISPR-associated protein Csb2
VILSLEFLGPYAAADVTRKDAPEWPPHPDRVYQSFVDAACLTDQTELDALRWLEAQPPPGLVVPDTVEMLPAEVFVPVNYPDSGFDLEARSKQPRSFPMVWPKGAVSMVWPDPPADVLASLIRIGSRVSHVGRAESQVLASIKVGSAIPQLVAHTDGNLSLRVPFSGRLDALEAAYQAGRYAPPAPSVAYLRSASQISPGPWSELITVRLRHPLSVFRVVDATEALRRAVLSLLGDDAPASVHGHAGDGSASNAAHVAWVGLPNLSAFARGELLGLGIALPAGMPVRDRARCLQALLAADHLVVSGRRVELEPPSRALSLEANSWVRPSRRWKSVTPAVLDRFPKKGRLTAEEIVKRGLIKAGYPEPKEVRLVPIGALGASMPSAAFRLRRPGRLYTHVEIDFASPVRGPLLLGAERYFGLGLCLPVNH